VHRQEPVVLFCHVPPVTSQGETAGGMVPANAVQVLEVIKRCGNVAAVLCGHDHALWSRIDGGILYSCGPGFCDTLGGVLPYSFRIWRVYPDRLEGVVEHVTADDQVRQTEGVSVTLPWPAGLRPRETAESAPVRVTALPSPKDDPLVAWFGPDWVAVPGSETPVNWREDAVLVPGKQAKAARMLACDEKAVPPADAQGRAWFLPDYAESDAWQTSSLPAVYWDPAHPRPEHQRLFFRVPLDGKDWQLDVELAAERK
jgi:hypothetical protein